MKTMIVRADDVGYTRAANDGTFKAIDEGVVTSADLMLDATEAVDAMVRLRERPWISVGWHTHFWGRPVLPAEEVPSMVDENGRFRGRHDRHAHDSWKYEEIVREMNAELDRCERILGHVPAYSGVMGEGAFSDAMRTVCKERGIILDFMSKPDRDGKLVEAAEKYRPLNIYMPNQPAGYYREYAYGSNGAGQQAYSPAEYYISDYDHLSEHDTAITAWHPGFLDDMIIQESSLHDARVIDVVDLTSERLKKWIIAKRIRLASTGDVLFGTDFYQEHLRKIGSPLAL